MFNLLKISFFVMLLSCMPDVRAQEIDSLKKMLGQAKDDTLKVNLLNELSYQSYFSGDFENEKKYAEKALNLAKKLKWDKGIASAYKNLGGASQDFGNYFEAIEYYKKAIAVYKKAGVKEGESSVYNSIGSVFYAQANYPEALKHYYRSLRLEEELQNNHGIATVYNNIGSIYSEQGDFEQALKNFNASLAIRKKLGEKRGIASAYTNIGVVYTKQKKYDQALENYKASLAIKKEIDDKGGMAIVYNNIGHIHEITGNYTEALKSFNTSLKIKQDIGDQHGIASSHANIGLLYMSLKDFKIARKFLEKALEESKVLGLKENLRVIYKSLADLDSVNNSWKSHVDNYKLFIAYSDSINNEENTRKTVQTQMQYVFDKQTAADSVKVAEQRKVVQAKLEKEKTQRYALYGGLGLVLLFSGFIFNRFKVAQKQKKLIELKEQETREQKHMIEEKQKEIIDSIRYAKRIQQALLPIQKNIARDIERLKSE